MARHLVGEAPRPEIEDRYIQAVAAIGRRGPRASRASLRAFRRRPVLLAPLDAFEGMARRDTELQRRLLVMVALLETSPHYGRFFHARRRNPIGILMDMAALGVRAALLAPIGAFATLVVVRGR